MSIQTPPTLTAPPTPMDPADRATWNARAYAFFVTWLTNTFYAQLVAAVANVYDNAVETLTNAVAALGSANAAQAAAAAAQSTVSAVAWASGQTYAANVVVISQLNFLAYRRTSASPGSSTVDPRDDELGRWVPVDMGTVQQVEVSGSVTVYSGPLYIATGAATLTVAAGIVRGDPLFFRKDGGHAVTIDFETNGYKTASVLTNRTLNTPNLTLCMRYRSTAVGFECDNS